MAHGLFLQKKKKRERERCTQLAKILAIATYDYVDFCE